MRNWPKGDLHRQQDQWTEALPLFERSLAISEQLAELAPTNVTFQEDVQVSRWLVAEVRDRIATANPE